ncbi:MAG: nicotinate phosphoribosyltransferase [Actinobacteria bacterium]|nr:nicotinate phosphoribosyltransferase [Actinomycetota bacterium]
MPNGRKDLALLVDLYELTMAAGYKAIGRSEQRACFEYFFRELPPDTGFAVSAGLEQLLEFLEQLCFSEEDLEYLESTAIFSRGFLDYLRDFTFSGNVWAVPEGTVVFPGEPLVRVEGPLGQVQLIETFLLNTLNYATLVATKAARICLAAEGDPVMEFGLRRAHGPDGGLSGSRAAYIGGVSSTSNVLAGKEYGIPISGTQAHSWVMSFDEELEAFRAYAGVFPEKLVLLVDTYDTAGSGLPKALKVFQELRDKGRNVRAAVRLDSGDLVSLSKLAYRMFTEAGFGNPLIVASGDLDERQIAQLKQQGAKINCWGVGTQLITSYNYPALGGVYKLSAVERESGWVGRMKVSSSPEKLTLPGRKRLWRCFRENLCIADVIALADEEQPAKSEFSVAVPGQLDQRKKIEAAARCQELLKPVMSAGKRAGEQESLSEIRQRAAKAIELLPPNLKRLDNPQRYPVYVSDRLAKLTQQLLTDIE